MQAKRGIKDCGGVINQGKFPDVQRRSRGSATLPRYACRRDSLVRAQRECRVDVFG
jgi:hypothetical protein